MTNSIQIHMLGTPTVTNSQGVVSLGGRAQALLYYLAATAHHGTASQTRPVLAGLLWSESDEDLARMNLRKTLVDLRKVVGEQMESDYQTITFNCSGCAIDLVDFTQAVQQAATLDLAQLQAALDLYQGDFLQGFFLRNAPDFEQWQLGQRTYYRNLAVTGLQTLAQRHAQAHNLEQAINAMRRLLLLEPWHEEAHQSLMRWLAQSGQRSTALAQFDLCRRQLAAELAVEPNAETVALYEEIRTGKLGRVTGWQGDRVTGDAVTELVEVTASPLHNFPPQPTPFIGRQQEVADLLQRLADPNCRLLTLVGPGGMGKTRLAIEAAKTNAECGVRSDEYSALRIAHARFADGVVFVPLADVSTPSAVVTAIAEAATFSLQSNLPPRQQLLSHLADKRLLLLLDNFEHLLAGVELIAEILNRAPEVTLLVTSHEVLNLQEEWLYAVGGLSLPKEESPQEQSLLTSDALRLFKQAAQRARPNFDLAAEWRCALRICRQVDGMPLGIELATTWLRTLPCHQIADEIQRNLDFLASRLHNLPERHRSMRAVFEYSWHLLTPEEQQVLRRLSVLHSFCQEGAAAVAGASLFTLTTLAEKSLIQVVHSEGHGRYVMHELLRQFAAEKLQSDVAEQTLIGGQQSRYYLDRLRQEAQALSGVAQQRAVATLNEESKNIRTAWLWAAQQSQILDLGQSVDALFIFYQASHRYAEGVQLLEMALQAHAAAKDDEDWFARKLLNRMGAFYANLGRFDRAQSLLTTGLTLSNTLGLVGERAFCLQVLGEMTGWTGDFAAAITHLQASLTLRKELGDAEGIAHTLARLTEFTLGLDDYPTSKGYGSEYVTLARQLGNQRFVAHALRMLAYNLFSVGEFDAAVAYCREGLPLAEANQDQLELSLMLSMELLNSTMVGKLPVERVKAQSERALALAQTSGHRYYVAVQFYLLAQILGTYREYEVARHYCEEGIRVANAVQATAMIFACQAVLGDIQCQQGDLRASRHTLGVALRLGTTLAIPKFTTETLLYLGTLLNAESSALVAEAALQKKCQAVTLLALLRHHPNCLANLQARAGALLDALATALPADRFADAQAQGQQWTLAAAVEASLLNL